MDRRAALRLAVAMYTAQILAAVAVVATMPHSSSGGLAEFPLYFVMGDWLAVRLPLAAAAVAMVISATLLRGTSNSPVPVQTGPVRRAAAWLRLLSVGSGIASGSMTVGLVSWLVALRVEATQRFFPHLFDWSSESMAYTLLTGAAIGFLSVVFAFEPDDAPRAAYFALSFGFLFNFSVMAVLAYDVVQATYIWAALAALAASACTLVTATHRLRTLLAIVLAIIGVAVLYVMVFNARTAGAAAIALLLFQALSLFWLTRPNVAASAPAP